MADGREYRKLSGKSTGFVGTSRLFIAKDHILAVRSTGFVEQYKRFYFQDIQVILVRETRLGTVANLILAVLLVVTAMPFLFMDSLPAKVSGSIWGGILLVALVASLLKGATCKTEIRTAVQRETLPSLNRIRAARKMLEQVRRAVEAAQGRLTVEEIRRLRGPKPTASGAASPKEPEAPQPAAHAGEEGP